MPDVALANEEAAFLTLMKDLGPVVTPGDIAYLDALIQERNRRREQHETVQIPPNASFCARGRR